MRWIMALLASAATAFLIMPIHYRWIGHVNHNWMLITKVIPTLLCAAFAGAALIRSGGERYAWLIFIGLCICAAADVMLGIHFVTGGALFLLGHLFYMAAFCTQQRPNKWSFVIFAAALVLLIPVLKKPVGKGERILTALLLYACCQVVLESLRMDSCLKVGFVRVSQVISAVVILGVTLIRAGRSGGKTVMLRRGAMVAALVAVIGVIEWALDKTVVSNILLYLVMIAACAALAVNGMRFARRGLTD